ncbi:hypothetical protein [Rhizobium binxianense]
MSRYGSEIAEAELTELDERLPTARLAASILIAVFAYLGLLFGGNLVLSPSAAANTLSSSSRDPQPLQITARDAVRGVLAADRKIAPKQAIYDSGPIFLAAAPGLDFTGWAPVRAQTPFDALFAPAAGRANQPRAPPASA